MATTREQVTHGTRSNLAAVARDGNMPALRGGEELEVIGGPCRKVLCEQGRSSGQQETLAGGDADQVNP